MKESSYKYLAWIILAVAFSFMICIFAPLDAYFANMDEYWFSVFQLLSVTFFAFVVLVIIFALFALLIKKLNFNHIFYAVVISIFIFLYIQGNYIPRNYGALDGSEIMWDEYKLYAMLSVVLFVVCLIFLFLLLKFFKKNIYTIGIVLSLFVLIIQFSTIGVLFLQNINNLKKDSIIVTDRNLFDYSKDDNIIVFMLDSYDAYILNEMLEEDKDHQADIFENFTYYVDTVGCYPTTKASMPIILSGEWYENQMPFKQFVNKVYENNGIYKAFKENNYKLDVYTYLLFLNENEVDYSNVEEGNYIILNKVGFAEKVFKLVGFNYMPHQFKKYFLFDNEEFSEFAETDSMYSAFSLDEMEFLKKYNDRGISTNRDGNVFKFYHLEGNHAPATFGKDLVEDGKDYKMKDEGYGNSELLKIFFDDFKQKGIYDNSTIIIMADHGAKGYRHNPIFLIKNKNEYHPFEISNQKMSFEYLKDIWISIANGEHIDQNFIKSLNDKNPARRFLYYTWDGSWNKEYMPGMQEIYFNGTATDNNYVLTGRVFMSTEEKHDYKFGDILEFNDKKIELDNVLFGVNKNSLLNKSLFSFDFTQSFKNILVEIETEKSNVTRLFTIKANDKEVANIILGGLKTTKTFIIPEEFIANNRLELSIERVKSQDDSFNDLDASGIKIKTVKLESIEETVDVEEQIVAYKYNLGTLLDFHSDVNTGYEYVINGFSGSEEGGTWTNSKSAKLKFNIGKTVDKDLYLELSYKVFNKKQHILISCNDTLIADYIGIGEEIKIIKIPSELTSSKTLNIEFILDDAVSPESLNLSKDKRELALRLYTLKIYE